LDQRLGLVAGVSHGPDVSGRDDSYPVQGIVRCPDIGAVDHAPAGAVPVFGERLTDATGVAVGSHGPDVSGRDDRHADQLVKRGPGTGSVDHAPVRAVPVLGQGLADATGVHAFSYGPDIGGRDGGYPVQLSACPDTGAT